MTRTVHTKAIARAEERVRTQKRAKEAATAEAENAEESAAPAVVKTSAVKRRAPTKTAQKKQKQQKKQGPGKRGVGVGAPTSTSAPQGEYARGETNYYIPRTSIRKLAHRAKIGRLAGPAYWSISNDIISTTTRVTQLARILAEYERRTTVSSRDVARAWSVMREKIFY